MSVGDKIFSNNKKAYFFGWTHFPWKSKCLSIKTYHPLHNKWSVGKQQYSKLHLNLLTLSVWSKDSTIFLYIKEKEGVKNCLPNVFQYSQWNSKDKINLKACNLQLHWQFLISSSCFWLVENLLRKFDTLSKKEMKVIETQKQHD